MISILYFKTAIWQQRIQLVKRRDREGHVRIRIAFS